MSSRRSHRPLIAALAALSLTAVAPSPAAAADCAGADLQPNGGNIAAIEAATLCLVNAERTSRGLAALSPNADLARAARGHSQDMVSRTYFSHDSLGGSTLTDRVRATGYLPGSGTWELGENIAYGTGVLGTPRSIVKSWLESPGHRANMLRASYRELGVGVAPGVPLAGRTGGGTYTTDFGYRATSTRRASGSSRSCARYRRLARKARTSSAKKRYRRAARRCVRRAARA